MGSRFNKRVVLVAGGTGGLGEAVVLAFLHEGASVHVTYRSEDGFSRLKKAAGESTGSLIGHRAELTDDSQTAAVIQAIGQLDVIVNAIGGYAGGSALWETSPETFDRMMSLNVRSGFLLARNAIPAMIRQGAGVFINISSRAAVDHAAGASAYAAAKAAAVAMMDSLAADLKGKGVRVNTVLPSIIDTRANREAMPGADFTKWPKPEEIADVILFLSTDESRLIHGASIPVYGTN